MNITNETVVGELVAQDYRTAAIFKKYGIDFCCNGNHPLQEVCEKKGANTSAIIEELNSATESKDAPNNDYQTWSIDLLADYIEKKHHRYVEAKSTEIKPYLDRICSVHGNHHPELFKIKEHFIASAGELAMHMKKEELVLFPYIRKMVKAKMNGEKIVAPHFGTVQNPIQMMMHEHTVEGDRFTEIQKLSNNYTPPEDACNTYRVTFALLKEFEDDLHLHIHLENNILFPKAIAMEKELNN